MPQEVVVEEVMCRDAARHCSVELVVNSSSSASKIGALLRAMMFVFPSVQSHLCCISGRHIGWQGLRVPRSHSWLVSLLGSWSGT